MHQKRPAWAFVVPFFGVVLLLFVVMSAWFVSLSSRSDFLNNNGKDSKIPNLLTGTATPVVLEPMVHPTALSIAPIPSVAGPTERAPAARVTVTPKGSTPTVQARVRPDTATPTLQVRVRPVTSTPGVQAGERTVTPSPSPAKLTDGIHLLVDDYWIGRTDNIRREVMQPTRMLPEPVISSTPGLGASQTWVTVLYDPTQTTNKFRMWYNAFDPDSKSVIASQLAYLDSADGIHWAGPPRILNLKPELGASIVDEGPGYEPAERRFKLVYWEDPSVSRTGTPGMKIAYSPDGLTWTQSKSTPFSTVAEPEDDIWNVYYDPRDKRYGVFFKQFRLYSWLDSNREKVQARVRLIGQSRSRDFEEWTRPQRVFAPDAGDEGITEWYGVAGVQRRGDLLIGFLKVLRDDVTATGAPPGAAAANNDMGGGIGWTTLAWRRGEGGWSRDRGPEKFFEPNPEVGTWDHAVAWIDSAVQVGEYIYLYYGGYRWGHKYQPTTDRQIGLARMKVDRFVALTADEAGGSWRTRLLTIQATRIRLNVNAAGGEVKFQISDATGKPIPGFSFVDCQPITVDSLSAEIACKGSFKSLANTPVHLEFSMKQAQLFALDPE